MTRRRLPFAVAVLCGLVAAVAAAPPGAGAAAAPRRVLSLNLCADQLLVALLPPQRIASVTWLSASEGDPALLPVIAQLHHNHGSAEEVLALRPDLVVAGRFTTATTRRLLRRAGVPLVEIDAPQGWNGIRRVTREVAAAVGEPAAGERLLSAMEADLHALAAARPARPYRVIGWGGSGTDVPGRDTLFNTLLEAAGGENLAAPAAGKGSFDLEAVLLARPDVLLRGAAYAATPALRGEAADHRVLRRLYPHARLTYPEALFGCAVPRAARAALELQRALQATRGS